MRWEDREQSRNVEDRRGKMVRRTGMGLGIGSILLIGITLLLGGDPSQMLQQLQQQQPTEQVQTTGTGTTQNAEEDELARFVSVVLNDTEEVWNKLFREQMGTEYQEPVLVLFSGQTQSNCGHASAATGPFYCPADNKLYIDLSFYQDLKNRFKAPGDFAMAYVVAHEVAHHIQNLLGITEKVFRKQQQVSEAEANALSVRLELQADFLAGVWAHHAEKQFRMLEKGDIEEALNAAHAIGDDRIQQEAQGYVIPDSFTHGTSKQRMDWFYKGFTSGDMRQGDTFAARNL